MGNKKNRKRPAKRRSYHDKYKLMMDVVHKRKRLELGEPSAEADLLVLENVFQEPSSSDSRCRLEDLLYTSKIPENNLPQQVTSIPKPTDKDEDKLIQSCNETPHLMDLPTASTPKLQPAELSNFKVDRRIINVSQFYEKIKEISNHGPLGCNINCIDLVSEKQNGLISKFTFMCKMCNLKFVIDSDNTDDEHYLPVNNCAVAGIISIGGGHSHLEEFSAALNLPLMSNKTYQNIHDVLSKKWEEVTQDSMDHAAEKERNIAITEGRVSAKGIPVIDVIADGCYGKRSYKTNYSALSGAGAIIGRKTGEILYLGVRNKYCFTCDRAEKKKERIKEHVCFKNYSGSSTGMETDIIVEGFQKSVQTHNLIYGRLISDGDSNTYNKILQVRPYQNEGITVEKLECRNHLLRNFCNKLKKLQSDTHYPPKYRKQLTQKAIMCLRSTVIKAIAKNKGDECPEVQNLFDDICLAHHHAFGNHSRCRIYFCEKRGVEQPTVDDFFTSSLWQRICLLTQNLAGHARSLIHDVDSNTVERYHSIVAKLVGGKRINFSLKQSYRTRCHAAAASFNTKKSISRLYKSVLQQSPRGKIKTLEERRIKKRCLNTKYFKKKNRVTFKKRDVNYGEQCQKPDMPDEIIEKMKEEFIRSLKKTDSERDQIQKKTILQRDCSEWMELRRSLLTASNFGLVIKRRKNTKCANLVKKIMYATNLENVASIKHGRINEEQAIRQLAQQESLKIEPCGLYIDKEMPFLGASPDGVSGDTIIELKCPITAYRLGLEEAVKQKKVNFWKVKKNGTWEVNKNHNWYYQVQGQLHVTQKTKCLFAVWSSENKALRTEIIARDDSFWENAMKLKLENFYMDCMLPEVVDPRFNRNLPIREPPANMPTDSVTSTNETTNAPLIQAVNEQDIQPTCSRYLNFNDL